MKKAVRVPVMASLNGITSEGWVDYACQLHEAGATEGPADRADLVQAVELDGIRATLAVQRA